MDKVIAIILTLFILSPPQENNKSVFSLVFIYDKDLRVNLKQKKMKQLWNEKSVPLRLSSKENRLLWESFYNNQIDKLKGDFFCTSDTIAVADDPEFKVLVYKNGRLISNITLDDYFDLSKKNNGNPNYRPAQFVNDLKDIFKKNIDFAKSLKAARAYEVENHFIRL